MQLTLHATARTPGGDSPLAHAMPAWPVKTRHAASRHCKDASDYVYTIAAIHDTLITHTLPFLTSTTPRPSPKSRRRPRAAVRPGPLEYLKLPFPRGERARCLGPGTSLSARPLQHLEVSPLGCISAGAISPRAAISSRPLQNLLTNVATAMRFGVGGKIYIYVGFNRNRPAITLL